LLADEHGSWWASFLPWVNSIKAKSITREFYTHPLIRNLVATEKRLPTYIPARKFALAVMDMVAKDGDLIRGATNNSGNGPSVEVQLEEKVNDVTVPDALKRSIKTFLTPANGDTQHARLNVGN
jgi:hypothetical protein